MTVELVKDISASTYTEVEENVENKEEEKEEKEGELSLDLYNNLVRNFSAVNTVSRKLLYLFIAEDIAISKIKNLFLSKLKEAGLITKQYKSTPNLNYTDLKLAPARSSKAVNKVIAALIYKYCLGRLAFYQGSNELFGNLPPMEITFSKSNYINYGVVSFRVNHSDREVVKRYVKYLYHKLNKSFSKISVEEKIWLFGDQTSPLRNSPIYPHDVKDYTVTSPNYYSTQTYESLRDSPNYDKFCTVAFQFSAISLTNLISTWFLLDDFKTVVTTLLKRAMYANQDLRKILRPGDRLEKLRKQKLAKSANPSNGTTT